MKQIILFSISVVLFFSCFLITPRPTNIDEIDMDAISTAAYQTALAAISNEQTMTASVWTATYTPTLFPTPTPSPTSLPSLTASPFPAEIETLLQGKCEMPWHQAIGNFAVKSPGLFERYINKGCRLPVLSPNQKYLAYLTPGKLENQDVYVETVNILQTSTGKVRNVHFSHD